MSENHYKYPHAHNSFNSNSSGKNYKPSGRYNNRGSNRDRFNNRLSHSFADGSSVEISKSGNEYSAVWNNQTYTASDITSLRTELRIAEIQKGSGVSWEKAIAIKWEILNSNESYRIISGQSISVKLIDVAKLSDGRFLLKTNFKKTIKPNAYYVSPREEDGKYTLRAIVPFDKGVFNTLLEYAKKINNDSTSLLKEINDKLNSIL